MAAQTKAYTITNPAWTLVAQNATEVFIQANGQYDMDLYIGATEPGTATKDFIMVDRTENFSASSLESGTDLVYIRSSASSSITVKVLTL